MAAGATSNFAAGSDGSVYGGLPIGEAARGKVVTKIRSLASSEPEVEASDGPLTVHMSRWRRRF